jgi:hypothetical protein
VYPIGRAVVVRRQAGSGSATMWIALGATAASLLTPRLVVLADVRDVRRHARRLGTIA